MAHIVPNRFSRTCPDTACKRNLSSMGKKSLGFWRVGRGSPARRRTRCREAAHECAPSPTPDDRLALGHARDLSEGDIDGAQGLRAESKGRCSRQRAASAMSSSAAARTTRRTPQPAL